MRYLKYFLFLLCIPSVIYAEIQIFSDITENDPDLSAIIKFTQNGTFEGIPGPDGTKLAALDNNISKINAALFLCKIFGVQEPTIENIIELKIFASPPKDDTMLDYATWSKMLSNIFQIPVVHDPNPENWYFGSYLKAQSIGAINIETQKPKDLVSRRFMLRMTDIYLKEFIDKKMDEQEKILIKIRDDLINAEISNNEIQNSVLENIIQAESIPQIPGNNRLFAIKNLNIAVLPILKIRENPEGANITKNQERAQFFLKKSVSNLDIIKPFAGDLEKIMCALSTCNNLVILTEQK